jgi:hypothetical protein
LKIIPIVTVLFFIWRNWQGQSLCNVFCQCTESRSDQDKE